MIKPIADLLTEKGQSRYALCVGISKRAREIAEDAEGKGEILDEKPVELAVQELEKKKFRIVETNRDEDEEADEAKAQKIEEQLISAAEGESAPAPKVSDTAGTETAE